MQFRRWLWVIAVFPLTACGGSGNDNLFPDSAADGAVGDGSPLDGTVGDGGSPLDGTGGDGGSSLDGTGGDGGVDASTDATGQGDTSSSDTGSPDASDAMQVADVAPDTFGSVCTMPAACYTGPAGTEGTGVCRGGSQPCVGGMLGACTGEVVPTPEACNGLDDNCNGTVDEGLGNITCGIGACATASPACVAGHPGTCTPGVPTAEVCGDGIDNNCNGLVDEGCACVHVAPTGSDTTGTGAVSAPFQTIQHAITQAGTGGLPTIVCVAAGPTCALAATYTEAVTMRNGVDVYGGYQAIGTTWPRVATCVTKIANTTAGGVQFDATITSTTILDGFTVQGTSDPVNAGITVTGSTGAQVSNDIVSGGAGATSIGIDVTGGATPRIELSSVTGGTGTALAAGVRSNASAPVIQDNCGGALDAAGRCATICGAGMGVRARPAGVVVPGTLSYGISLVASPRALVQTTSVCAQSSSTDSAGIRITGNATGTVIRENTVFALQGAVNAVGVLADPCGAAAPWIFDNSTIAGNSSTMGARADGIRAVGDCHPVIDSNQRIVGGIETANANANGIFCVKDAASGISSTCTVLNNTLIQGSSGGYPPQAVGVRCDDGACARIENNALITGVAGTRSYGVVLGATGTFVNANHIEAGCGVTEGDGILATNSYARIQNNNIGGGACNPGSVVTTALAIAVHELVESGLYEVDLDSNDLLGRGVANLCNSHGVVFDVALGATAPAGDLGIVRNNIVHPGLCNNRSGFAELNMKAVPRILQNNDFWVQAPGDVLLRDQNTTDLTTAAAINALKDTRALANISADPLLNAMNQLTAGSPCIDTGTAVGAPATDINGTARPIGAGFDIGSFEYHP
jgi:hypothetical protein